jgi:hypothetical protein
MHEPSSRPVSGRERQDGWKTASVEGKGKGFKVSGFQSFKDWCSRDTRPASPGRNLFETTKTLKL